MKRFIRLAAVIALALVVYSVWAKQNYQGIKPVVVRTDTLVASTRTSDQLTFFDNTTDWLSVVGDIVIESGVESTGTSRLESTKVVLCSDKGIRTYRMDSINWDTDTLPDTLHISRLGNDTLMGHNLYLLYTLTDTFNTTHNVPVTWKIKYNLEVR